MNTTSIYRIVTWSLFLIIVGSISLSEYLEKTEADVNIFPFVNHLIVQDDKVLIEFATNIKSLELLFSKPLNPETISAANSNPLYTVQSTNGRWISVISKNGRSFREINIRLVKTSNPIYENRIIKIKTDNKEVSAIELIHSYSIKSNLKPRYFLSIANLNWLFSNYIGHYLIYTIIAILAPVTITQFILIIVAALKYKKIIKLNTSIDLLDKVTINFAIPLGLLGTVASLWLSFSYMNIENSDIHGAAKTLSDGLFTTLLGIIAYLSLKLRQFSDEEDNG